ncbi:hypothetical protein NFI95_09330 [Acetobacteraceae bacterium KSS8]|uniref:Photosynthesis system II assembly factor Ycf48/Hcf136-like domain-containing protein n=1 Tax=Endosaccharibacter trunci TaxID=2812733 RepID=A0ABT1W710_9PROT|nr:hypothetical protein [Acetobacteraceae bacterium KSS8]
MPRTLISRACAASLLGAALVLPCAAVQASAAEPSHAAHPRAAAKMPEPAKPASPPASPTPEPPAPPAPPPGPLDAPAPIVPNPAKTLVEALARAGSRLVAVGLHGLILISDDNGLSWRQVQPPVQATLTGVAFADDHTGWAIGHYGVVLRTENAGESWSLALDLPRAALVTLDSALSANASDAVRQREIDAAHRLAAADPSLPFLLMQTEGTDTLRAIGAGGLAMETNDAGRHWHPWSNAIDNPDNLPLLGLAVRDDVAAVDGGQGILLAGRPENGLTRLKLQTDATLFGALNAGPFGFLLYGQQGNAFVGTMAQPAASTKPDAWHQVESPTQNSFTAALLKRDGGVLLGDSAGMVWSLGGKPDNAHLDATPARAPFPILAMADTADGALILAGSGGVLRIEPPAPPAPPTASPVASPAAPPAGPSSAPASPAPATSPLQAAPATPRKPSEAKTGNEKQPDPKGPSPAAHQDGTKPG